MPPPLTELHEVIRALRSQSTWRLLGLCLVTYFVYAGFYARRQSLALNSLLPGERRIPSWFVSLVLNLQIASGVAFLAYLFVEDGHPVEELSNAVDLASGIAMLVWGFVARSRVNFLLQAERGDSLHFSGLWTFLFTPLYFNYKVNSIADADYPFASRTAA